MLELGSFRYPPDRFSKSHLPCQDEKVRQLFEKIKGFRAMWKAQEKDRQELDAGYDHMNDSRPVHGDDDEYTNGASSHAEIESTPTATSNSHETPPDSAGTSGSKSASVLSEQLASLGVCSGTLNAEQQQELAGLLADLENLKIDSKPTSIPKSLMVINVNTFKGLYVSQMFWT